jgi:agmatine/peptidylarginine deiminase
LAGWVDSNLELLNNNRLIANLIEIIESQLSDKWTANEKRAYEVAETLKKMGFKVVFVPRIGGDPEAKGNWSGISFTNFVLVDNQLFLPIMGLGQSEDRLVNILRTTVPEEIEVIPVFAQYSLGLNGGTHCVTGILRSPVNENLPPILSD